MEMKGFDEKVMNDTMILLNEFYNYSVSMNITTRKLFLTGMFEELNHTFASTIFFDQ
jgi:hypothetical protein